MYLLNIKSGGKLSVHRLFVFDLLSIKFTFLSSQKFQVKILSFKQMVTIPV